MYVKRSKYKFRGRRQRAGEVGKAISCDGKVRYDKKQAHEKAALLDYDYAGDGRKMRAYRCIHCGYYHIGRAPKRV